MDPVHRIADSVRSFVSSWTPTPLSSQFVAKGTLTPNEFVDAGDQLTFKFPTWQWQSAEPNKRVAWLPVTKQCLLTRNVLCRWRISDLDSSLKLQKGAEGAEEWMLPGKDFLDDDDDDFCTKNVEKDDLANATDIKGSVNVGNRDYLALGSSAHGTGGGGARLKDGSVARQHGGVASFTDDDDDKEDSLQDIFNFKEIDDLLQETDLAVQSPDGTSRRRAVQDGKSRDREHLVVDAAGDISGGEGGAEGSVSSEKHFFVRTLPQTDILRTRSYDLSITYDKYYQTPRIWLFGYDEDGIPLTPPLIFQDILSDYISKTVTIDPHPCTGIPTVSIHPCRHAAVMHKVVKGWIAKDIEPRHDLALFVLLKFIASVVPTIEYDFTMDVDMFSCLAPSS